VRTTPRLSVVIPAHQEQSVIGRCLDALSAQLSGGEAEVVVVANGCTDRTAEIARSHASRPQVLELPVGSKSAALNAGEAAVSAFPRIYLDADIVLGPGAVDALARVLGGQVHAAAPVPQFETTGRPRTVRSYYRTWQRLPFLNEEPIGNGVYALSMAGRARFGEFPPLIADDLFVLRHFARHERRALLRSTSSSRRRDGCGTCWPCAPGPTWAPRSCPLGRTGSSPVNQVAHAPVPCGG
jgi:glycosyltransferase involved in cell wall biosynthesis